MFFTFSIKKNKPSNIIDNKIIPSNKTIVTKPTLERKINTSIFQPFTQKTGCSSCNSFR